MQQNDLRPAPGSKHKRKIVGRGNASGHGSYSGKGIKGQKSRSGAKMRPGFEGGQLPLIKRLPKMKGFTNNFRIEYSVVNVADLNRFAEGSVVSTKEFLLAGVVKSSARPVKVLADGELAHPLTVRANKFSAMAKKKIEAAGGKTEEV